MPAERAPSTTSTPSTLSGRRLLSRIAAPFANKSRSLSEYYVHVDDPHKQYSPGDSVTGHVHLRVLKPIRVTHVVVCLHGFVQVYKNPGSPPVEGYRANNANVGKGNGSRTGEYFGNGFASLFEDEVVLCGDGRLGEGEYQFNYDLLFPDRDLPSSISFERGTISYMITATITRPTTIAPTIQCDHKVYLVERIDISQLYPPKSRTITLEPLSRKRRARTQARKLVEGDQKSRRGDSAVQDGSGGRRGSQTSSSPSMMLVVGEGSRSPVPSEISFDSLISGSGGRTSQLDSNATFPKPSVPNASRASLPSRTITATVESLQGGCLRGDTVSIKVTVNHTKYVKSLHGVIITLYRQARVDMHPAIPLGPIEKGKEIKYDDYYPKSVTGLGGLSLSGAGSCHNFRKDLSQTIVPLIVNPTTLTAEVTGRVHIPDEAFPTISSVPGAMISFIYYVEVVLDIQGKLSSQDRNLGNLGGLASTMSLGQGAESLGRERSAFNSFGSPVIDTATVRRDKGVVACTFEVIVGTKDSERRKGKRKAEPVAEVPTPQPQQQPQQDVQAGAATENHGNQDEGYDWYGDGSDGHYDQQYSDYGAQTQPVYGYNGYDGYHDQHGWTPSELGYAQPLPVPMPSPQEEDESQLPEKERLRRAEARLLPSQPPETEDEAREGATPTAPYLPDEQSNGYHSIPILLTPPVAGPSSNGVQPVPSDFAFRVPLPKTPDYDAREGDASHHSANVPAYEPGASSSSTVALGDDKRDLQRQKLELEASAPPDETDEEAGLAHVPTAPTLTDEDELYTDINASHADADGEAGLPRYER